MSETETEGEFIGAEPCVVLDRRAVISASPDLAIIRVKGKGPTAVHIGLPPEGALRLGAALLRAGLRIRPGLSLQVVEDEIRAAGERAGLKVIEGEGERK